MTAALSSLGEAKVAMRAVALLLAIGQLVTGAQAIVNGRTLASLARVARPARVAYQLPRAALALFASTGAFTLLGALRCASAIWLAGAALGGGPLRGPLLSLAAANLVSWIRVPHGHTGADEVANVVVVALLIAALADSGRVRAACLAFIALQAALAYGAAGWRKVGQRGWRDGSYVAEIAATAAFGAPAAFRWLQRGSRRAQLLGLAVVTWECSFPLVLMAPRSLVAPLLMAGILFHATSAGLMGLNTFLWTFPATYPAVVFLNLHLNRAWMG